MRRSFFAVVLILAGLSGMPLQAASAEHEVAGTWRAVFVDDPAAPVPKTVSEMTFEFDVEGDTLGGMARMGNWPGQARISEGKIEDDTISFTVIGRLPWCSSGGGRSGCGYPKLKFTGTVHGSAMKLSLDWGSIVDGEDVSGADWPAAGFARVLEMVGRKISD